MPSRQARKARQVGEGAYEVAPGLILQRPCDMLKRTVSASVRFFSASELELLWNQKFQILKRHWPGLILVPQEGPK